MATNYPSSLDSFINPQPGDSTVTISHAGQHDNINDAVTALETKVGVNNSTVTNSIDYLLKANPEGFLINGQIVVSESGGNLTVALKGLNGQDPSATNPVYVTIGNTVRSVTSALSVTKNAATKWFDAGSSELATQLINYFTYLGYNSTDGVVIGFARIPYAKTYGDFSATTTNAKYCAISTITNATSTDIYVNIGRFSATLSAGSGYTWSISGTGNVINRPIYETDWLTWQPVYSGSLTYTQTSATTLLYKISDNKAIINMYVGGTTGGTDSNIIYATLPFRCNSRVTCGGSLYPGSGTALLTTTCDIGGNVIAYNKYDGSNIGLGTSRELGTLATYNI